MNLEKVYITNEHYKIADGEPLPIWELFSPKNSTAAFTVVIDCGGKSARLTASNTCALPIALKTPIYRVAVTSAIKSRIYTEGYIRNEHGVPTADILFECSTDYAGNETPAAFVEMIVGKDEMSGDYPVTVSVFKSVGACNEEMIFQREISLEVYPLVAACLKDAPLHLDLWQQPSSLARAMGVEPFSGEHFIALEKMIISLAELGQKSVTVIASDCPWRGWGCHLLASTPANLFEYSIVKTTKEKGKLLFDFSALARYIELCSKHGINGDITVYGLMGIWKMPLFLHQPDIDFPENVLIRYKDEDGAFKYLTTKSEILEYYSALFDFFKKLGVIDKVRIGADEPSDLAAYHENLKLIRSVYKDAKFKMAFDKAEALNNFKDDLSDVAASYPLSESENQTLKALQKEGKRVLWYVCNIPEEPNTVLKNTLTQTRYLLARNFLLSYDGFLRWAYNCWTVEPLKDIRYNNSALPAGDVCFIYPGKNGDMLYSLRYKALKRAIEDYSLFMRIKNKDKARAVVSSLTYKSSYNEFDKIRTFAINEIINEEAEKCTH